MFPGQPNILVVPSQALLFRENGMQVALIDDTSHVHLQDVSLGDNIQVTSGLKPGDKIVAHPSLGLLEGQEVKVVH